MAKHKKKFWEPKVDYVPWDVVEARREFDDAMRAALISGDYEYAKSVRVRGRVNSVTRKWSDRIKDRVPRKWW